MTVRVRFAPSPTGYVHAGNIRAAIVTWLFARKNEGHFLLRIDDTDLERSRQEYEDNVEDSLRWLGLTWDDKTRQKDRGDRYAVQIEKLKAAGRLYACWESTEELALKRKTQLSRGMPPIYDRAALKLTDDQKQAFNHPPHWRFKMNAAPIAWDDMVRGPVKFDGAHASTDPVLIREDGSPLYHLCSVIDDIDYDDHACHPRRGPCVQHRHACADVRGAGREAAGIRAPADDFGRGGRQAVQSASAPCRSKI